jgi:hypothetical protein
MTHLTERERLALIEEFEEQRHPHLDQCGRCMAEVAEARALLAGVRSADVPEPSPLFWEHFSARVAERLDGEPARGREAGDHGRGWLPWRVLAPLAAAVLLLVTLVGVDRARQVGPSARLAAPASSADAAPALGPGLDGAGWEVLGDLAVDFDVDTLNDSLARSVSPGVEAGIWELNDEERAELTRLLRAEMPSAGSGS